MTKDRRWAVPGAAIIAALGVLAALLIGVAPAHAATSVQVGSASRALDGTDVNRATNFLVMYTSARGATTGTNQYGFEAAVVNGTITQVQNGVGNMAIPSN